MTDHNERLIEMVKAAGQEIIDRAEEIVGCTQRRVDFDITIDFPQEDDWLPTVTVYNKSVLHKAATIYINSLKNNTNTNIKDSN